MKKCLIDTHTKPCVRNYVFRKKLLKSLQEVKVAFICCWKRPSINLIAACFLYIVFYVLISLSIGMKLEVVCSKITVQEQPRNQLDIILEVVRSKITAGTTRNQLDIILLKWPSLWNAAVLLNNDEEVISFWGRRMIWEFLRRNETVWGIDILLVSYQLFENALHWYISKISVFIKPFVHLKIGVVGVAVVWNLTEPKIKEE